MQLRVDGLEVSILETIRVYQAVPFPAGHKYDLVLTDVRGWPWDQLAPDMAPRPGDQHEIFFALERLIASEPNEGSPPAKFALNTVSAIELGHGEIRLEGVCSPIVSDEGVES